VSDASRGHYTIGAAPDCDIVLNQPQVSGHHARLSRAGNSFMLEDLGSTNGTFIDGTRVRQSAVTPATRIGLGSYLTSLDVLLDALSRRGVPTAAVAGVSVRAEVIKVGARMLTIGRDAGCDVCIAEPAVSGRHARVFRNCGRIIIEDIGSANGTFVRGERISWWVVRPDDVVQIGSRTYRFERDGTAVAPQVAGARLDLRGVCVDVRDQATNQTLRIIREVSFTALPGEIVGIMGRSGSGKTTLLRVLAGVAAPSQGEVLLDATSLHDGSGAIDSALAPLVGFAPQDDIVHELLTVEDAVRYSARLRCPAGVNDAEIERRVTKAIDDVGLADKRRTRIGSATAKSLSGGQRKRVSIAMELVTDPPLVLLDEPTSGLSSRDAAELMALLRRLADEGRTVVLTIHQPSYPMFVQMDQVVILEEGQLAYFGPSGVDVFEFFDVRERQAGAVFDRLAETEERRLQPAWPERYRASPLHERTVVARAGTLEGFRAPARPPHRPRGMLSTLVVLVQRGLTMKVRDRFFWVVAVAVPLLASLLIRLVVGAQRDDTGPIEAGVAHTCLLVMTIMVCFFGALSSSLEIVYERAVFARERRSGLGVIPYVASKALMFLIPAVLHPAVSLSVFTIGWGQVLTGHFAGYTLVLVPAFFAAACAGLLLSALMRSPEGVVGLAVAYSIVQTVFAGFAPLHVSYGARPAHPGLKWTTPAITSVWCASGLVTQSNLCAPIEKDLRRAAASPDKAANAAMGLGTCRVRYYEDHGVHPAEKPEQRVHTGYAGRAVAGNAILAAAALICTGLVLRRRRA
jgi:ABC-type multidrug transport system ATPase subunit/pSer/pThr/pTyr-binding forkhead associated (FHA) protein